MSAVREWNTVWTWRYGITLSVYLPGAKYRYGVAIGSGGLSCFRSAHP